MDYVRQYIAIINGVKLLSMFGLIALDWILGVLVAVWAKEFKWSKLANFLDTDVLKLAGGYFLVGIFAIAEPGAGNVAVTATWVVIDAKLLADCVTHFKELGIAIKGKDTPA